MSAANVEAPYAIASVPNPLDSIHGRIQASSVTTLRGSRKRKRHEVAVGIDGEGVNVYNVQSHRLITSYALPPQSYLCCPPCSVYYRQTATEDPKRSTFLVIRDAKQSSKRRLLSYTERARSRKTPDLGFAGPTKRECRLYEGEVLSLEIISGSSDEQRSVLVNYKSGGVEFINDDLSKTHWEDPPREQDGNNYEVEHATVLDVVSAKRGILKSREDVVALLEQDGALVPSKNLLCRFVRLNEERRLELFDVRDPIQSPIHTWKSGLQLLMSYILPSRSRSSASAATYELDAPSGTLYQLLDGKLHIMDLSSINPKIVTELGGRSITINSFARISPTSVLAFSKDTATLFETSFGSVQGSVSSARAIAGSKGSKRKRDDSVQSASFDTVSTFTDLGLVVGLAGNELSAFQVRDDLRQIKPVKSHGTLLSDVIGKGGVKESHDQESHQKKERKREEWAATVDELVAEDDVDGLERLVAGDPRLGRQRKPKSDREADEFQNGDAAAIEELWPLPEAFDPQDLDKRKILYVLSKVFNHDGLDGEGLGVHIVSLKLLEWLALTGYLTISYLKKAFRANAIEGSDSNINLKPGDIMTAIRQVDDDFQLMRDLLSLPVHWEAAEVIEALRHVINSFDTPATDEPTLALPAPPQPNGDIEMTNGDANSDVEVESESKAAENELDYVMNALTTGLEVRSDMLRVIILRLHAFPSNTVTTIVRSMMSHSEIIFFIHILRIELADGGWTSKYVDDGDEDVQDGFVNAIGDGEEKAAPSDQAIKAIADLLNCTVDAMGTSGWLVGQSSSALRTDDLIDSLRAEISAGLEGCYEADTLGTLFTELERCAASARESLRLTKRHEANGDDLIDLEQSSLPLGSRRDPQPLPGRKGLDRKKSKMAIGREKSKRVGKYSFERIRI